MAIGTTLPAVVEFPCGAFSSFLCTTTCRRLFVIGNGFNPGRMPAAEYFIVYCPGSECDSHSSHSQSSLKHSNT